MTGPLWLDDRGPLGAPRWRWSHGSVPILDPERAQAIRWSYQALHDCLARCRVNENHGRKMWASAVEGVWWVLALDESLTQHLNHHVPYAVARGACPEGQAVQGMTWLRHRHAHDLSITGFGGPKKKFFSSGPGVFHISPNNRWKYSKDVLVGKDRMPHLRPAYDAHVAGYPVEAPLAAALAWFTRVFEASGIDPDDPECTDESVM